LGKGLGGKSATQRATKNAAGGFPVAVDWNLASELKFIRIQHLNDDYCPHGNIVIKSSLWNSSNYLTGICAFSADPKKLRRKFCGKHLLMLVR
jgi:hypothetical protein